MTSPKSLIVNSPYDPPSCHWQQAHDGRLTLVEQRRPVGYEIFDMIYYVPPIVPPRSVGSEARST